MFKVDDPLPKLIIGHEGNKLKAYQDSKGIWTIGVGRNLQDKGITNEESMFLFDNDINECVRDLINFPWFVRCDPIRQQVLIDMRFNLGPTRFRGFKKMILALMTDNYLLASQEIVKSELARNRAEDLRVMMKNGIKRS